MKALASLEQQASLLARQPVGMRDKGKRAFYILRHYRFSQVVRRGFELLTRRLHPKAKVGLPPITNRAGLHCNDKAVELARVVMQHAGVHPGHRSCDLENGILCLLNHKVDLQKFRVDQATLLQQSHLWRFQYHYHEFLLGEAANGHWDSVNRFIATWLEEYRPESTNRSDDSWHPYCISRRVVVWIWLLLCSRDREETLGGPLTESMLRSLVHQCQFLSSNLEWGLGGNHLLENATALAIASGVIDSEHTIRWRRIATKVLQRELPDQILDHGEHFELSPMYHCQILSNLLRIYVACADSGELVRLVESRIDAMLRFLSQILHPDGEIPLFADSVFFEAPSVSEIREVAKIANRESSFGCPQGDSYCSGNYLVSRSEKTFAICDFGSVAAPHLPAHGHCDAFNVEVSVGGERLIVDSGNFNYTDDSMRHYCRSSIAHNVVTIDTLNQADIWSKFRMGRRVKISEFEQGSNDRLLWASAAHDGYSNVGIPKLKRIFACAEETLFCIDVAQTDSNATQKQLVGHIHLHPEALLTEEHEHEQAADCFQFKLSCGSHVRVLNIMAEKCALENGWYCDQFGVRRPTTVIRYITNAADRLTAWWLHEGNQRLKISVRNQMLAITMNGQATLTCSLSDVNDLTRNK